MRTLSVAARRVSMGATDGFQRWHLWCRPPTASRDQPKQVLTTAIHLTTLRP